MKTKLLMLIVLSTSLYSADANMSWVDQKIDEIKPQRNGITGASIASLKNPFIYVKPKSTGKAKAGGALKKASTATGKKSIVKRSTGKFRLEIVLNSSALINGKWYKENAMIRGYKLTQIHSNNVVLKSKKKTIKLFIAQKNKNLDISTK